VISSLKLFNDLLVEGAVCQIAVDEFEHIEGEDNAQAYADQIEERDNIKLALIDLILKEGSAIRQEIYEERARRRNKESRWVSRFPR
jgi:hypothetical protein